MQFSPEIDKIAPALVKAQTKVKGAIKTHENAHFKNKYADLASVYEACADALHSEGLAVLQGARNELDMYGVETLLVHTSGQWVREVLMLKPTKPDPQGAGSAISYARRYSLAAMIGVMQEDDDANKASEKPSTQSYTSARAIEQRPPLTGPQAVQKAMDLATSRTPDPASGLGSYQPTFGKYKDRALRDIPSTDLVNYCGWLTSDAQKKQKPISAGGQEFIAAVNAYLLTNGPATPTEPKYPHGANDFLAQEYAPPTNPPEEFEIPF